MLSTHSLNSVTHLLDRASEKAVEWSTTNGVAVLVTLAIATFALRFGTALINHMESALASSARPETSARRSQRTRTLTIILRSTLKAVVLFAMTLSLLSAVGINITPILASAGVVGLAIGFGAQSLVKDVISGFFILFEDQYGVGDVVDIDGKVGLVERMNLRITQLRNGAGELITIPNGSVKIVSNQSKEWARAVLEVTVDYATDIDTALSILTETGMALRMEWPDRVLEAPDVIGVQAIGATGTTLKVIMKTAPLQQGPVASEWRRRTKYAFDQAGIRMPALERRVRIQPAPASADAV